MGKKKIVVDESLCVGCGACEATAPEYFKINDDGVAEVIKDFVEADTDLIDEAIAGCGVGAISITEEEE